SLQSLRFWSPSRLVEAALKAAVEHRAQGVLVAGGLDDELDALVSLDRAVGLLGCSPREFKRARSLRAVMEAAARSGVATPKAALCRTPGEAAEAARRIGLPAVLKPDRTSGGYGIRVARSLEDIIREFKVVASHSRSHVVLQEYIEGADASVSLIATGQDAVAVSLNQQILGLRELGQLEPLGYSGNITPLRLGRAESEIREACEELCRRLGLRGSIGVDFVVRDGEAYLMEVNPRFQATLECVEEAYGVNLVELHLSALEGKLPEPVKASRYAARLIVYAKQPCRVGYLHDISGVRDVPPPGTTIEKRAPVCSVLSTAQTPEQALRSCLEKAREVYEKTVYSIRSHETGISLRRKALEGAQCL
ncbi:MAG: hypothetical protein DRN96_03565, partial [Thermoproteota archaeon]